MHTFTQKNGFTLIEIIVSMAIFSVVAVVALSALVKIVSANKKAQTLLDSVTNLNFALDSMTREMRVGSTYYCSDSYVGKNGSNLSKQTCDGTSSTVVFVSSKGTYTLDIPLEYCPFVYAYRFVSVTGGYKLQKYEQSSCSDIVTDASFYDFTSDSVLITDYKLRVSGDAFQKAFVYIKGYAGVKEKDRTNFEIQTAISARI